MASKASGHSSSTKSAATALRSSLGLSQTWDPSWSSAAKSPSALEFGEIGIKGNHSVQMIKALCLKY